MRKIIFLLVFVLTFVFSSSILVHAQSEQEIVAVNFLKFLKSDKEILSAQRLEANELAPAEAKVFIGYLVQLKDGGYILISASKDLTPVKAYSLSGSFDALPEPYKRFLLKELEYNVRTLGAATALLPAAITENQQRWNFLLKYEKTITPFSYTPDTYLLTTKWNQGYPYNKFLPEISGKNVLAGCVNIAVGQLMKYYSYPASAKGIASYTWNSQQLKTILYRDFSWQNMPDVLDSTTPEYKIDEVALLIKDLGIVNHTSFGLSDSGAAINTDALIENFGFSNAIQSMKNTDLTAFFNTLRGEIDAMRPVLLSFPGHMTVADGYANDGTGKKIHVNMGWGGTSNDYYYLDLPVYYDNNTKYFPTDPGNLSIIYNVKSCSGAECTPNLETGDTINNLNISGKFSYDRDADRYNVYLKGSTGISGSRGYGNQAFYIGVYDSNNAVAVQDTDSSVSVNLPAGFYTVRVSLCNLTGSCHSYADDQYANYTVSITTETLTPEEKTSIDSSLDIGPVVFNNFKDIFLSSASQDPYKILIDARDENGNAITFSAANTNNSTVQTDVSKNILSITPVAGALKIASKITVTATANGKTAEKSFIVMALNEDIAFGKKFVVNGVFENQSDFNSHKVILDGSCATTGYNGYSNQAFFTSVKGLGGNTVVSAQDASINNVFSSNIYFIGASLQLNPGGYGSQYDYKPDQNDKYSVTVSCPSANDNVTTIAQMIGVDLSGTEGNTPTSSVLALKAGWNLISLPLSPSDTAIATVLSGVSGKYSIVWAYTNSQWKGYDPSDAEGSDLKTMEAGKGYWIKMTSSDNLTISGTPPSTSLTLTEGWNLVGYNNTASASSSSVLSSISNKCQIVWAYMDGQWKGYDPSDAAGSDLTEFTRGYGYWIKVNAATTWQQ